MFVGCLSQPLQKQLSAASTFIVSTNGEIDLIDHQSGDIVRGKSFLIPVGSEVGINTHGTMIAYMFLDALGADLATLIPQMKNSVVLNGKKTIYSGFCNESSVVQQVRYIWDVRATAKDVFGLSKLWIGSLLPGISILADERVTKAVLLIKQNYTDNTSVANIAKQVNLSGPRLMQLFSIR